MKLHASRLHLHNGELLKKAEERQSWVGSGSEEFAMEPVSEFGFPVTTCCGKLPMDNTWQSDWTTFYFRQRLQWQYDLLLEKTADRELLDLWPQLIRKAPACFTGCQDLIKPSLLHGDLWSGNVAESDEQPVIFDPASFYGHSEFEFGIMTMFGGFGPAVYNSYRKLIPKKDGYERRLVLYQLFHYLNHWNHFGTSYRSSSISLIKKAISFN